MGILWVLMLHLQRCYQYALTGQMVQRSDRLAMIGQIAAGTAHEIRNPLTSIKGFLQMLTTHIR